MTRLKWVNFSHNQINCFPTDIIELRVLTKLNLSFNKIEEVPAEINQLTRLKELNLSHNEISNKDGRTFPDINLLLELLHLDLSHNALEVCPKFKSMAQIGTLQL